MIVFCLFNSVLCLFQYSFIMNNREKRTRYDIEWNLRCSEKVFQVLVNPLINNTILDWSKLKQVADNILKCI